MLMGLFRDSVMKCFCHTCSVNSAIAGRHMYKKPLSKKINKKPRCKQPKKVRRNLATEIRAEEKSRGGMSYEVILSQAVTDRPASPPSSSPPSQRNSLTHEQIDSKLELAEQRRKNLEAERIASVSERMTRLEEAAKKRQEFNEEFVTATAEALDSKLDTCSANREAHLDALRARMAEHLQGVEMVRKSVEEQTEKLRADILAKLSCAQENRDDHFRTIMAKLQAHEAGVRRVRESHEIAIQELDERIRTKQDIANENREAELQKKLDALRNHFDKVEGAKEALNKKSEEQRQKLVDEIRQYEDKIEKIQQDRKNKLDSATNDKREKVLQNLEKMENKMKEVEEKIKTKMTLAENNKILIAEQAKKQREEQERRAEQVRANKERLGSSSSSEDLSPSSG